MQQIFLLVRSFFLDKRKKRVYNSKVMVHLFYFVELMPDGVGGHKERS